MNVAVQTNIDASAPVHVQSAVWCQPVATAAAGGVVSVALHIVTLTVSRPPVESDATGSPFIVVGSSVQVASNSEFWSAHERLSVYVNAPNVSACLAGETLRLSTAYVHTA